MLNLAWLRASQVLIQVNQSFTYLAHKYEYKSAEVHVKSLASQRDNESFFFSYKGDVALSLINTIFIFTYSPLLIWLLFRQ